MLRRIFAGLIVLVLAAGFAPAPKPKPKPKNDAKALEGSWELTNQGNTKAPANVKMTATIVNGYWTFNATGAAAGGPRTPTMKYKMTVDAAKTPPWLDLEMELGGRTMKVIGIYQLKGDTLTYAYTLDNKAMGAKGGIRRPAAGDGERPTKFTGAARTMTLKRIKK